MGLSGFRKVGFQEVFFPAGKVFSVTVHTFCLGAKSPRSNGEERIPSESQRKAAKKWDGLFMSQTLLSPERIALL